MPLETFVTKGFNPCFQYIEFKDKKKKKCKDPPISPLTDWLGSKIIYSKPGEVAMNLVVTPKMTNPVGVLHGGIQSAILDEIIGITGASLNLNYFLYAIDLQVDYLRKAYIGEHILIISEVVRKGRRIINCIAKIYNQDCKLISQAKSNLLLSYERF